MPFKEVLLQFPREGGMPYHIVPYGEATDRFGQEAERVSGQHGPDFLLWFQGKGKSGRVKSIGLVGLNKLGSSGP